MRILAISLLSVWILELFCLFIGILKAWRERSITDKRTRKVIFGPVLLSVVFGLAADFVGLIALVKL